MQATPRTALAPPSGHVQGGGGVREDAGVPPNARSSAPHRSIFLPLQRERLKNIERICCLLRKVSVRVGGRRLLAQLSPTVIFLIWELFGLLCHLGGNGRLRPF